MKILVFPDLHLPSNLFVIEAALKQHKYDKAVFLGDYYDSYDDIAGDLTSTIVMTSWLKSRIKNKKYVFLIGNHDLHYANPHTTRGSGWNINRQLYIDSELGISFWKKCKFAYAVDNWLFTHAGLSLHTMCNAELDSIFENKTLADFAEYMDTSAKKKLIDSLKKRRRLGIKSYDSVESIAGIPTLSRHGVFMRRMTPAAVSYFSSDCNYWAWYVSPKRGGSKPFSGILWSDASEFDPINRVNQMFGHTYGHNVRIIRGNLSLNYCIDTTRGGEVRHYAMVDTESKDVTIYNSSHNVIAV